MQIKEYPKINDLKACEDEPIHLITYTQSHGYFVVLDEHLKIAQLSDNCASLFETSLEELLQTEIKSLLDTEGVDTLTEWITDGNDHDLLQIHIKGDLYNLIPHRADGQILLDIEPCDEHWDMASFQHRLFKTLKSLSATENLQSLCDLTTSLLKEMLGYDRVMIYQFDPNYNGAIIAEARNEDLESWLGLHYPAGDIPKNARDLFMKQGVRLLSNVNAEDARVVPAVNPSKEGLLDIGRSHLRSSSKIHIEYLKNMGVGATLSCAIVQEDKLWGMIVCHHYSPNFVNYQKRISCQLLTEMIANLINLKTSNTFLEQTKKTTATRATLLKQMSSQWDIIAGLTAYPVSALDLLESSTFAILYNDECIVKGKSVDVKEIYKLNDALYELSVDNDAFNTNCISNYIDWCTDHALDFSGVLYHKISSKPREALLWLRPEITTTVDWGGNPNKKNAIDEENSRLTPRKSFKKWTEEVSCTSKPWLPYEIGSAEALVTDIRNIIVTKFSEVQRLNEQLQNLNQELESFSYSVSHDLRGPLRGIDGFAQILLEDYGEALDSNALESLNIIIRSAGKMNSLMDDILRYSGLGKIRKINETVNAQSILNEVISDAQLVMRYPETKLFIEEELPDLYGDKAMIYQLFLNLLSNAFKYSSTSPNPEVRLGAYKKDGLDVFFVKDNGIGFSPEYAQKIFGVFSRLVKDEFEGTGVGLAITQRIVFKHGGKIWAESALNEGATFSFYLANEH